MTADSRSLESRLFRSFWDDGLLDLFAGIGVLGIGACWAVDLVAIGAVVPAILLPFWVPMRRALVEPRIGMVEFADARVNRMSRLGRASLALGVLTLLILVGLYLVRRSDSSAAGAGAVVMIAALPAVLLGLMAVSVGWALGLPRFLWYGAAFGLAGSGVAVADARPEIAMLAGGVIMLLSGAARLRRFMRIEVESGDSQ